MIDKVSNNQVFLLGRGWHPTAIYMQKDRSSSIPDKDNGRLDLSFDFSVIKISARPNFWLFFVQGRFEETNGRTSPLPVAVPP